MHYLIKHKWRAALSPKSPWYPFDPNLIPKTPIKHRFVVLRLWQEGILEEGYKSEIVGVTPYEENAHIMIQKDAEQYFEGGL